METRPDSRRLGRLTQWEAATGGPRGEVRAIAIYHLDTDGLIDRARFLV